ncbi:MAG: hypothetical protein AAEC10_02400, partial [Rhodospirillales bacterium]
FIILIVLIFLNQLAFAQNVENVRIDTIVNPKNGDYDIGTILDSPYDIIRIGQWKEYLGAQRHEFIAEDEALIDAMVPSGHPSTPGYSDPKYPYTGRQPWTDAL